MDNKAFVFLYPDESIFGHEIDKGWFGYNVDDTSFSHLNERDYIQHRIKLFREIYSSLLNRCIDERYRQQGFSINYALLDDCEVSDVINLRDTDRVLHVGMSYKTHTTKREDGSYPYPNQDYILNQLGEIEILRVGGFHLWDCVERLAKRAYERGLDVLVDEDLTQIFALTIGRPDFKTDEYPNYNPRKENFDFEMFMEARKNKPWMWQDY